jgi:hypothetical protein
MNNNSSRNILNGTGVFIIFGTLISLFYFSFLMPLHVDEGSIWYHFTNRTWFNRFYPDIVLPHHTLTTYMAKWSLPMLGYNGIGLRFPVILFGGLNIWLIYSFVKKTLFSDSVAVISTAFLAICPVFVHYSHELRGYSSLVFFSICSYYCLFRLLQPNGKTVYWWLLFLSFVGCYLANYAALMFFWALLSTIWILRIVIKFYPNLESLSPFKNISLVFLFIYSLTTTLFFVWVVVVVDSKIFNQSLDFYTNLGGNYIAIPDIFSTFFGYKYLDDPSSLLYSYPLFIWLCGLFYFGYGIYTLLKNKSFLVPLFLVLCGMTISVYALSGKFIPVRSAIYLLPFIVIFQAYGLKESTLKLSKRWFPQDSHRPMYVFVSSYLIGCFCLLTIGKYTNLHADSGNPYELARNYLINNTGPNDLIISSLYDTVGGFYLGAMIREKNYNIYKNGRIDNIYYLAPKADESKMELEMVYPVNKKVKFLPLEKFEPVASYKNKGVRTTEVNILKRKVDIDSLINFNQQYLLKLRFTGKDKKFCNIKIEGQNLRLKCEGEMACASRLISNPDIKETDEQVIFYNHVNDRGADAISYASLKSLDPSFITGENRKKQLDPFPNIYMVNHLVNNIDDTDEFKRNVDLIDVTLQKMGNGKNILYCMKSSLFQGDSLINGVRVFNLP